LGLSSDVRDWTGVLKKTTEYPIGGGAFSDVYKGALSFLLDQKDGVISPPPVVFKVMRIVGFLNDKAMKKAFVDLRREIQTWRRSQHENVLPFLGITNDFSRFPSLVSPWMENGSVNDYLQDHPNAERITILSGISKGLRHLHGLSPPIYHGDLKPGNILIDHNGNPKLTDFGLSWMQSDASLWQTTRQEGHGTLRYMSPELFESTCLSSDKSDVYAFGMTAWEIFAGEVPFFGLSQVAFVLSVVSGKRPPKKDGFPSRLYELLCVCWMQEAEKRPSMKVVCSSLAKI